MKNYILVLLKKLTPNKLKRAVHSFIAVRVHRAYIDEWTSTMLIPLEQKLLRFESQIEKIEAEYAMSLDRAYIDEWTNTVLVPLEEKLLRLEAQIEKIEAKYASPVGSVPVEQRLSILGIELAQLKTMLETTDLDED